MIKKKCEVCNKEYTTEYYHKKYCDECRITMNKESAKTYYTKGGIGIYKITNLVNEKVYIGQSVALHKRINMHKNELKYNKHKNYHLQRAVNKYGFDSFKFETIEHCKEEELYNRENYWMLFYKSHDSNYGYNIYLPSEDERKFRLTDEAKLEISERNTRYSDEELLCYLQEYFYMYNTYPSEVDFKNNKNLPTKATYVNRFGSIKNALIIADVYEFIENKENIRGVISYTKEDIIEIFSDFISTNRRFPNHKELRKSVQHNLPNEVTILKHFGSVEELKRIFGFDKESVSLKERNESLKSLYNLYLKYGQITSILINKDKESRSCTYYSKHFGSVKEACKLAKIPEEFWIKDGVHNKSINKYSLKELEDNFKETFHNYYMLNGEYPSKKEFIKHSKISFSTYRNRINESYIEVKKYYEQT